MFLIFTFSIVPGILHKTISSADKSAGKGGLEDNNKISANDTIPIKTSEPKNLDISNVEVSEDIVDSIKKFDVKNAEKNIDNYKKVMVEFDVPEEYKKEINSLIKDGSNIVDIFIAYNFLSENYGQIKELDKLVSEKSKEEKWTEVFHNYNKNFSQFKPSNFEKGTLEDLMKTLNADDIMIADKISQKGIKEFNEIIEMRKSNKSWKEIKIELGIVNMESNFPHVAIANDEVEKYKENENMGNEQIIKALALARKNNLKDEDIIKKIKNGEDEETIYSQYYKEKYS